MKFLTKHNIVHKTEIELLMEEIQKLKSHNAQLEFTNRIQREIINAYHANQRSRILETCDHTRRDYYRKYFSTLSEFDSKKLARIK